MPRRLIVLLGALAALTGSLATAAVAGTDYHWHLTNTGSDASLRGLAAVNGKIAWASGSEGTVLRTLDAGKTWQEVGPPGTETLQFRDIEAWDADHAVIMAAGVGTDSRIYVTSDGGATWQLTFENQDPAAFYDCMTFFDRKVGLAISDPPDGQFFRILRTTDGGLTWSVVPTSNEPPAQPGEFAFAASGQCLTDDNQRDAWFGTGGGTPTARVFHSTDRGKTWTVSTTPIPSGPTSGIFALAFKDAQHGIAVGGDYANPAVAPDALATTDDGGATWQLSSDAPGQYRSGVTFRKATQAIAVGTTGSDISFDAGLTWQPLGHGTFNTVDCAAGGHCWAAGATGRVARLVTHG